MRKKIGLSALIVIAIVVGCEKEFEDEYISNPEELEVNSSLIGQVGNSFPYVLERVNIEEGSISIFLHHQGNKAEHKYNLVWDGLTHSDEYNRNKVFLALSDVTSDTYGGLKSSLKLDGELNIGDSTLIAPELTLAIINLSDSTVTVELDLSSGTGSWVGTGYADSTSYTECGVEFLLLDSTYIDSTYTDSLVTPWIPVDSTSISS